MRNNQPIPAPSIDLNANVIDEESFNIPLRNEININYLKHQSGEEPYVELESANEPIKKKTKYNQKYKETWKFEFPWVYPLEGKDSKERLKCIWCIDARIRRVALSLLKGVAHFKNKLLENITNQVIKNMHKNLEKRNKSILWKP